MLPLRFQTTSKKSFKKSKNTGLPKSAATKKFGAPVHTIDWTTEMRVV